MRTSRVITAVVASAVLALAGCSTDTSKPAGASAPAGSGFTEEVVTDGITVEDGVATITIGVSPVPHAQVLQFVQEHLAAGANLNLDVVEFSDYQLPNSTLESGDLAANYFQTPNFLKQQEADKGYDFTEFLPGVHIEPLGFYSDKYKSVEELPNGARIALNNDPANTARALKLLAENKLIELADVELPSDLDVTANPKNFEFVLVDGAQTARALADVDAAVINGNYAIEAGKVPSKDALLLEAGTGSPYANLLVVRTADKDNAALLKLQELLTSPEVKEFIESTWTDGSVIPAF
ncbi:MetQ/NlpA family ABC transporter substrate-binding protein [Buchananella felis]|uniref:MetQ/NlpA family ABC transporter substrate-binding protein n=1 Tax=Buchananella felis TaxID=3231492 RepID=UPI0035294C8F